jgi:cytochrome P450
MLQRSKLPTMSRNDQRDMQLSCTTGGRSGLNPTDGYFRDYGPEQRAMVERWLDRMRRRLAGARDVSDVGRVLARERHLETLNQPLPMSAQRFARLQAEVADVQGEGAFLLVVDCGETGTRATRLVRRFETLEALQEAKRKVDAERCGPGCWRNHLLYRLTPAEGR